MKFLSFLSLALTASAAAVNPVLKARAASPKPPTLTLLFSANLTIADPIVIGQTPFGEQVIVQVTGGAFSGPKLAGAPRTSLPTVSAFAPQFRKLTGSLAYRQSDDRPRNKHNRQPIHQSRVRNLRPHNQRRCQHCHYGARGYPVRGSAV